MRKKISLVVLLSFLMTLFVTSAALANPPQWVVQKNMAKDLYKNQEKIAKEMQKQRVINLRDIQLGNPFYKEIYKMAERGIINGYQDGNFKPDVLVTRDQFAKMLVLSMEKDLKDNQAQSFVDVSASNIFFDYIETAKPYLTGYSKDGQLYFYPAMQAVREDVTVAIVKSKGLDVLDNEEVDDVLDKYADEETISKNLRPYVATAIDEGLIKGWQDKSGNWYLGAQNPLKRVDAALLLYRACNGFEKVVVDDEDEAEKVIIEEKDNEENDDESNENEELTVEKVNPEDDAEEVAVDLDELTMKFNSDIQPVDDLDAVLAGIVVTNLTEDEEIDIESIEIDDDQLIIELEDELDYDCEYEVEIAKNIIEDEDGDNFGEYSWEFTTLEDEDEDE